MIYNVESRIFVLISVVIIILMCLIGEPIANWAMYKIELRKSADSYDALVAAFEQIENSDTSCVEFSDVMDFDWDTMYIFGPYTTAEKINDALGQEWQFAKQTSIDENDSITLILFTEDEKVTAFMEIPRGAADFASLSGEVYSSDNACFSVDEAGKVIEP